jgi:hypothetical protein
LLNVTEQNNEGDYVTEQQDGEDRPKSDVFRYSAKPRDQKSENYQGIDHNSDGTPVGRSAFWRGKEIRDEGRD